MFDFLARVSDSFFAYLLHIDSYHSDSGTHCYLCSEIICIEYAQSLQIPIIQRVAILMSSLCVQYSIALVFLSESENPCGDQSCRKVDVIVVMRFRSTSITTELKENGEFF